LRAVALRGFGHQLWRLHRGGVDAHLVRAGVQECPDVVDFRHPAAYRQWDEDLIGDRLDHVVEQRARLHAGGDVQKCQLVGALRVVAASDLDRVAGVAQVDEVDALYDAAVGDVEAGDDAFREAYFDRLRKPGLDLISFRLWRP
jgi:hypothetical protein